MLKIEEQDDIKFDMSEVCQHSKFDSKKVIVMAEYQKSLGISLTTATFQPSMTAKFSVPYQSGSTGKFNIGITIE